MSFEGEIWTGMRKGHNVTEKGKKRKKEKLGKINSKGRDIKS
jgi:hypothetical protein